MNNVRDAGFSRKRGGNAGSGPPLLDPAGIEETIVDNEWNTVEFTNGHAPGKFFPRFKAILPACSMSFGRDRKEPLSDTTKRDCTAVLLMIFLYSFRVKELLSFIFYCCLHLFLVLSSTLRSHITGSTLLFLLQIQMSVAQICLVTLGVSLIRCRLKGLPLFGVIGAFLAVMHMKTWYSTGILENQGLL